MNERIKLIELYLLYENNLTGKQREYFHSYYFDDLSLSEISENNLVSRSIVSRTISNVVKKLNNLENILKEYENNDRLKEIINKK